MDYSMKVTAKDEPHQEHENETQTDAASPSSQVSSVEPSENVYPCPACPSVLSSSHELTNHLRDHNSPRSTDCSGEDDYSCGICNKVLSSASSLDRHVLVHSGERPYKCKLCNMSFTTNGNMNRHLRTTHQTVSSNSCTDSEGSSDTERPAATGQDEYNNNEIAKSNSPNNENKRKRAGNEDVKDEYEKKRKVYLNNCKAALDYQRQTIFETLKCPMCDQDDFVSSAFLESHIEYVHRNTPAKCEKCDFSFKNHRMLNLHRSMRHRNDCSDRNVNRNLRSSGDSVIGFNDLTFVDFSSDKFPTIARAICEQAPHQPVSGDVAGFQCARCQRFFPCKSAKENHEEECNEELNNSQAIKDRTLSDNKTNNKANSKSDGKSANTPDDESNNKPDNKSDSDLDRSENSRVSNKLDDKSNNESNDDKPDSNNMLENSQVDNSETDRDIFFAVLDLKNKSKSTVHKPKESKDLADIESILTIAGDVPHFPRSDSSTPENNIRFNLSAGSSGSSGTYSVECNEEETLDGFAVEFRKMKLKGEFPCRLCPAIFPNLRALKGHNRAHMGVPSGMPYPCNMCPYTSSDKATLVRHLRSHNGDRPYECSLCKYAFTTKANCERHVRNRHGKLTREDIKSVLIYHPNEDSTNENIEKNIPRISRDDVRKSLIYSNEPEEVRQQQVHYPAASTEVRGDIRMIEDTRIENPGPSAIHEAPMNHYEEPEIFSRPTQFQPLKLVQKNVQETNILHDIVMKPSCSKFDDDAESRSSDDSMPHIDVKSDPHRVNPINLKKSSRPISSVSNTGEDGPLDLSMDVLDLSKKSKDKDEASGTQKEQLCNPGQKELYKNDPFFFSQTLLKAREGSPAISLETLCANAHLIYHNLGTFAASSGIIPPYLLNHHVLSQGLTAKGKLQKELVRGLQLTGGGTLDPSLPSSSYANYLQTNDIVPQTSADESNYTNLINMNKNSIREKGDNIPSSNSVKMVIKNGVLMPKQKQRRYRTERPFTCEHCSARFTLRSNMERHIKQQHPQYWSQRPRGGHSTRGRPPASHPTLLQNFNQSTSQLGQPYPNILPKIESSEYNKHPISDQVKYAILAQQLKANKMDDNDSEEELVIDEESDEKAVQKSNVHHESGTSLLRDQLENTENIKNIVNVKAVTEISEEVREKQNNVDPTGPLDSTTVEDELVQTDQKIKTEPTDKEQGKLEDGTPDLASVSKLLDNASQQYQQFQPQYLSDEEGLVASTSDGNNSGSDEKSDSLNSLASENNSSSNKKKKKKKKKKSAYSMAPNRVICPYCERPFPWTSSLRRHILTHTGQKPYRCIYCSLLFTTKSNCDRHLSRKHKTNPEKVRQIRNSSSPDNQVIINNNSTFSMRNVPERPYKCNQCPSSTFSTLGNLKKHRSTKHPRKIKSRSDTPPSDQQSSPPQCSKQNDQSDYETQSSSVSENMESSSCATGVAKSNHNTSPSTNETNRSRRASPRSSPGPGDVPFKCHLCDSGFAERQDCLEHIKLNHKRSYEMLMAKGALDMDIDTLEDQTLTVQQHQSDGEERRGRFPDYSNRKVVCAFCMRRFWSAEDLRRHMRTHTGERPFQCDICCRKFTLKHSMLRHRKKHESVDSTMYVGTSGDEENSPAQPPTITPRSQQQASVPANTSRPRTQDRISLPTVAAVATADAAPCALMRYNHYDNMTTLTGRMANDGPHSATSSPPAPLPLAPSSAEAPSESGDNDLISNLLGIREKGLLDKVLLSTADDAAKLLGVNRSE